MDRRRAAAGLGRRDARARRVVGGGGAATPNPEDAGIYGSAAVADYDFDTDTYLTLSGSDITVVEDRIGAFDFSFTNYPVWNSTGGPEGGGAAVFTAGNSDYGSEVGFNITNGGEPGWDAIAKIDTGGSNQSLVSYEYVASPQSFVTGVQERTSPVVWRFNGDFVNTPHNIDYATPDTNWHCFAEHGYTGGFAAKLSGTEYTGGGTGGTSNTNDELLLGRSSFGQYATGRIARVVNLNGMTSTQRDEAEDQIWRVLYPSISWAA